VLVEEAAPPPAVLAFVPPPQPAMAAATSRIAIQVNGAGVRVCVGRAVTYVPTYRTRGHRTQRCICKDILNFFL
jgi:hypothetical protein